MFFEVISIFLWPTSDPSWATIFFKFENLSYESASEAYETCKIYESQFSELIELNSVSLAGTSSTIELEWLL